jgi:hypothetical protein
MLSFAAGLHVTVWVLTAAVLLLAIVTTLVGRGIVHANRGYGIRLPSLLRSETAWRAGHAAAIPSAWIGFVLLLVSSIIGTFNPILNLATVALFVLTAIVSLVTANSAAHKTN